MRFKSITFDLDGTLLDTVGDITIACQRMLDDLALPERSEDDIRRFLGRGMQVLVHRCLTWDTPPDEALLARAIARFQAHYVAVNGLNTRFFPGVREGLAAWQATGLPLAVVTNKPADFTRPLLEKTGLSGYFQAIVAGDTTPHRKPHPAPLLHACQLMDCAPADNLHIGDSRHDIETARNAGCTVYCVPYGYTEGGPLSADECDALIDNLLHALSIARDSRP